MCSAPECETGGNNQTCTPPGGGEFCNYPVWRNGGGGFVGECDRASDSEPCHGNCNAATGLCPTSSCHANALVRLFVLCVCGEARTHNNNVRTHHPFIPKKQKKGSEEMLCGNRGSANCPFGNPITGGVTCDKYVPACAGPHCLGTVNCHSDAACDNANWQGVDCFYVGRSSNWKVCSSPACENTRTYDAAAPRARRSWLEPPLFIVGDLKSYPLDLCGS